MRIQIDGAGTVNKGAELMLYAILEQIEQKYPKAKIIFNTLQNNKSIITDLDLKQPFYLKHNHFFVTVSSRLKIPLHNLFTEFHPKGKSDLVLDASGFRHGDQWNLPVSYFMKLDKYYKHLKRNNSKIILLPQAFGPFITTNSKIGVEIINKYADMIIARDSVSKNHLLSTGCNENKIYQFPDFTILTNGKFPEIFNNLKDGVCIIPNIRMMTHSDVVIEDYITFVDEIHRICQQNGKKLFLLNHEGDDDLNVCKEINKKLENKLPIVTNLDAKETKGIIGQSYLVISSRYHGVANALGQSIPCFATSWNHKYETLFNDFGLNECIIDIKNNLDLSIKKIDNYLQPSQNRKIKNILRGKGNIIIEETNLMWKTIWSKVSE